MSLNQKEISRYKRHLLLPEIGVEGQTKLKNAKVLVIGAGGLGCPVLQYLTVAGVGEITIVDHDTVDLSNLQRQVLFTEENIGKNKAETAAKKLRMNNPEIMIHPVIEKFAPGNALKLIDDNDVVIDGTDNFETRYLVNDGCVTLEKPLVSGSIYRFEGQVSVFNWNDGPSYRCLYREPPESMLNCEEAGVLGVLPGIIGSIQANEAIKVITGAGEVLSGKLLVLDCLTLEQQMFNIKKDPEAIQQVLDLKGDLTKADYQQYCVTQNKKEMSKDVKEISIKELKEKMDRGEDFQLIDVREQWEYDENNIGGELIPLGQLDRNVAKINKNKTVIVHCKSGARSKAAVKRLQEHWGYSDIYNLKGGIMAWMEGDVA